MAAVRLEMCQWAVARPPRDLLEALVCPLAQRVTLAAVCASKWALALEVWLLAACVCLVVSQPAVLAAVLVCAVVPVLAAVAVSMYALVWEALRVADTCLS